MLGNTQGWRDTTKMVEPTSLKYQHDQYVASGCWKCKKSPTGAHHWYEPDGRGLSGVFYCLYCYEVKELPTSLSQAMVVSGRIGSKSVMPPPTKRVARKPASEYRIRRK